MRRFDAGYQRMHRTLKSGLIGEPVLITQLHRNPLTVIVFDETELITSSASHDIDVFRWLTGDDIREVSAVSTTSHDGSTVIVVLTLISRSGVIGVIELTRGPGLNCEIGCDIVGANATLSLPRVTDGATADSIDAQGKPDAWMERFYEAYRAQDAAWLAAVSAQTFTGPSAYDGYATNVVIDAALAARASGRTQSVLQEPEGIWS